MVKILFYTIVLLSLTIVASDSFAGTTGGEFKPIYDKINSWIDGYLGKLLAVGGGLFVAYAGKFQPLELGAALGTGLGVTYSPDILAGMVSAII